MHAIGNLVKALCFFVLAVLRARDQEDLRHFMLRMTAKGGLEKFFFREFRFAAAAIAAFPSLLGILRKVPSRSLRTGCFFVPRHGF